ILRATTVESCCPAMARARMSKTVPVVRTPVRYGSASGTIAAMTRSFVAKCRRKSAFIRCTSLIYSSDISQTAKAVQVDTAKIFWSGRSQAVRLPKEYRFEGGAVRIRREGRTVVLEPLAEDWAWLDDLSGPVDEDFEDAALRRPAEQQDRPQLDELDQ